MIELQNICFDADGKRILDNVSLTLDDRFIAVTGPNGSGKSTLAKIIMGIETPSQGRILLNGEDITALDITARARRGIGFAFQQPVHFKGLQVRDLLRLAGGKESNMTELCDLLSDVGLCAREYLDRELNGTLSGGEMKRIEIAMALARGAQFSIFDEPEAGIDLWSFQNLIHVFEKMHEKSAHGTVFIISHQERILNIADKILYLKDGTVGAYGPRGDILPSLLAGQEPATCKVLTDKLAEGGKQ